MSTADPWPNDPRYHFSLQVAETDDGRFRAFVAIQTVRNPGSGTRSSFFRDEEDSERERDREESSRLISRLASRLDLPDLYRNRNAARDACYEAARRFVAGQLSPVRIALKKKVKDYQLIGGAAFRPDVLMWEPTLTVKRKREASKGGTLTQAFDENNSPFRFNPCPTADRAASFALEYGERLVIGLVSGLKI